MTVNSDPVFGRHETGLPASQDVLKRLLQDPVVVKVAATMNVASLSTLELVEFGVTKQDVRYCYLNGIVEFDPQALASSPSPEVVEQLTQNYYDFWSNRKFRLTDLGLYILECAGQCGSEARRFSTRTSIGC
jgi:hypothetical protein